MMIMAILGGLHWAKGHSGQLAVAIIIKIAITAQQLGGGAPTYTLTNEISSLRLRAKTQSFALTVNFVLNWAYNLFVPKVSTRLQFGGIIGLYPIGAQSSILLTQPTSALLRPSSLSARPLFVWSLPILSYRRRTVAVSISSSAEFSTSSRAYPYCPSRRPDGSFVREQGPRPKVCPDRYCRFGEIARAGTQRDCLRSCILL